MASIKYLEESYVHYEGLLQNVQCALMNDPHDEELLKLQAELEEVMALTATLLLPSTSGTQTTCDGGNKRKRSATWEVGDTCMARRSDKEFYEAVIENISVSGVCTISFICDGSSETTFLYKLEFPDDEIDSNDKDSELAASKQLILAQREQRKRDVLLKAERQKEIDARKQLEREKWNYFLNKAFEQKSPVAEKADPSPSRAAVRRNRTIKLHRQRKKRRSNVMRDDAA